MFAEEHFKNIIGRPAYNGLERNRLETINQRSCLLEQFSHEVNRQLRLEVRAQSGKLRSH